MLSANTDAGAEVTSIAAVKSTEHTRDIKRFFMLFLSLL